MRRRQNDAKYPSSRPHNLNRVVRRSRYVRQNRHEIGREADCFIEDQDWFPPHSGKFLYGRGDIDRVG